MSVNCKWLPKRIMLPNDDWSEYSEYEERLYEIFISEIYKKIGKYKGKIVKMRRQPEWNNKHESFYHIICDKTKDKENKWYPNIERASRLTWGKAIIQHNPCNETSCNCSGLLSWDMIDEGKRHIHKILFKDKKYTVILEERPNYWLYITSYYIDDSYRLRKLTKEYHDTKTKNALQGKAFLEPLSTHGR